MATQIIRYNDLGHECIALVPDVALVHAGLLGNGPGHTDLKNASGSVFLPLTPQHLLHDFATWLPGVLVSSEKSGNLFQRNLGYDTGFDSLIVQDDTSQATGVIIKEERIRGFPGKTKAVLAPSTILSEPEQEKSNTSYISVIAPSTNNADYLPDDIKQISDDAIDKKDVLNTNLSM